MRGEGYVVVYSQDIVEGMDESHYYALSDAREQAKELSHSGIVGFYTTFTLTISKYESMRNIVFNKLVDRLKMNGVIPIRYAESRSYFRIDKYEKIDDPEIGHSEGGGFTFYPMSIRLQLWSIVSCNILSFFCSIGLKSTIYQPGIIRTLHVDYSLPLRQDGA